jgi:hypothetical protein
MNDILMTNIFFTITAVSSVVTTIMLVILSIYGIKLVRKVNDITKVVKDETVKVISDVEEVRGVVKQHVAVAKNVVGATFVKALVEKVLTRNKK